MLRSLRLPIHPNVSQSCLSWSLDGCLCILSFSDLVILVPAFRTPTVPGKRPQPFFQTRASLREWIVAVEAPSPAPRAIYSIGEETGPGYAKTVSWSPLGVSKSRGCMLAILTTNLKVVVFEQVKGPRADWEIRLDLTHVLKIVDEGDKWRVLKSRARDLAWSPACPTDGKWGTSVLAVSDDAFGITLLRVTREKGEILTRMGTIANQELDKMVGKSKTFISPLAWSPWIKSGDKNWHSFLAYANRGRIMVRRITLTEANGSFKVTFEGDSSTIGRAASTVHPVHKITWAPEELNQCLVLAYAVQKQLTIVEFDLDGNKLSSHNYPNDYIEPLSGLEFSPTSDPSTVLLQLVTSRGQYQTVTYPPCSKPFQAPDSDDTWQMQLSEHQNNFMTDHDLPSCTTLTPGFAVSPLGNLSAIVVSFHPSDCLEYITASTGKITLLFGIHSATPRSWTRSRFDQASLPNPYNMSMEAFLLESSSLGDDHISAVRRIARLHSGSPPLTPGHDLIKDTAINGIRYGAALDLLTVQRHVTPVDSPEIIMHSILSVLNSEFTEDEASKRILYSLASVGVLAFHMYPELVHAAKRAFTWLAEHTAEAVRFDLELGVVAMRLGVGERMEVENGIVSSMEKCALCGQGVIWRDYKIAECTEGHRFSRCSLTFLPIVTTRRVAECGVCGRAIIAGSSTDTGLARRVHQEWDVCLQCGGRYWGDS